LQRLPDNIFLELVKGMDIGTTVYHRDDDFLVFDDKFGVSSHHLDVIPTKVYADLTSLTAESIPMLERLYELGKQEFIRRQIPLFSPTDDGKEAPLNLDDFIVSGYNYPVSVKHLHLHMVLPPFRHEKVFQYPRFHPHKKVIADLKRYGKVKTYSEFPDDQEGKEHYASAMEKHQIVSKLMNSSKI